MEISVLYHFCMFRMKNEKAFESKTDKESEIEKGLICLNKAYSQKLESQSSRISWKQFLDIRDVYIISF